MIILTNTGPNTLSVQYVNGAQVFRKEVLPFSIAAYKKLTTPSQIVNQASLTGNGITIFNYTTSTYVNRDSGYLTGYRGTTSQSGLTLTTSLLTTPTGYTFITSAATTGVALNSATATTVGNSIRVAYSGAAVSTATWLSAINATAFSAMGITVSGNSTTAFISSGASQTISLSANTVSSNINVAYFIGDDVKRENYTVYNSFNLNATYASLSAQTNA